MKKPFEICCSWFLAVTMIVMLNILFSCENTQAVGGDTKSTSPASTNTTADESQPPGTSSIIPGSDSSNRAVPYDILGNFISSGWMGDAADVNGDYLTLGLTCTTSPRTKPSCIQITYSPGGPEGWAGVAWQNEDKNWCRSPGRNLSGRNFTQVKFWARGERGGEFVRFKAGGRPCRNGGEYHDSFETEERGYALERAWREYTIDLRGKDLSSVLSAFTWSAPATSDRLIFYIDDVTYQ
jgi:hypothetical protein